MWTKSAYLSAGDKPPRTRAVTPFGPLQHLFPQISRTCSQPSEFTFPNGRVETSRAQRWGAGWQRQALLQGNGPSAAPATPPGTAPPGGPRPLCTRPPSPPTHLGKGTQPLTTGHKIYLQLSRQNC